MSDVSYLTADGEQRLRAELAELKGPVRQKLAERLRFAIQQGDLSENADYIQAKEEQGFLEGRIAELERILRNVVRIEENQPAGDTAHIGSTVTILIEGEEEPETFTIVGPAEANPIKGYISYESPLGEAVLNKKAGAHTSMRLPDGSTTDIQVLEIK